MPPAPKPQHNRRVPKRAQRTAFSLKIRREIYERDNGLCIYCCKPATDIHHIHYRSELTTDVATKKNGCCLCREHHDFAHQCREFREWLRNWKVTMLDEEGELKSGHTAN